MKTRASQTVLSRLQRRVKALLSLKVLLALLLVPATALPLVIVLDVTLILPGALRAALPTLVLATILLVLAGGAAAWWRLADLRLARRLERCRPELGSRLTNAVQLADPPDWAAPRSGPVGTYLRTAAVQQGQELGAQQRVWPLEKPVVLGLTAGLGLLAAVWIGGAQLAPDVLAAVLPRLSDPYGDHPPFSHLQFSVAPGNATVPFGGQVDVRAIVSGGPVDKLYLVAQRTDGSDKSAREVVMFQAPGGDDSGREFFQTLTNLRHDTTYYVTNGRARSRRAQVNVRLTPEIRHVRLALEFPPHTGKSARTRTLDEDPASEDQAAELRLPLGTRVTVQAGSNRTLAGGGLRLMPLRGSDEQEIALKRLPDSELVGGSFVLETSATFQLRVTDTDGYASSRPRTGRFTVIPDRPPTLRVLEPGRDAVATPKVSIPVRVTAADDYGVARVRWLRSINGSSESSTDMQLEPAPGKPRVEAAAAFDLAELGVRPGDVITYGFEAIDNDPRGPNLGLSPMYQLRIISEEAYREILRRQAAERMLLDQYRRLDATLRRLAERGRDLSNRRKLARRSGDDEALRRFDKETRQLMRDMKAYRKQVAGALDLPDLFPVDPIFRKTLKQIEKELAELERALEQLEERERLSKAPERTLERLSRAHDLERREIGIPVEHLTAVWELLQLSTTFAELYDRQQRIVHHASRLRDREPPLNRLELMEMQHLAEAQRANREALIAVTEDLPDKIAQLPDDPEYDTLRHDAQAFLEELERLEIPDDMDLAERGFAAGEGPRAYRSALQARTKMESLLGQMQTISVRAGSLNFGNLGFRPSVGDAMHRTLRMLMGTGGGPGSGAGSTGGYLPPQVALYGPRPPLVSGDSGAAGTDNSGSGEGEGGQAGAGRTITGHAADAADAFDNDGVLHGAEDDFVPPPKYRNLVGEYFRRLADEAAER